MQNAVDYATAATLAGRGDPLAAADEYGVPSREEFEELLHLIMLLHETLVEYEPDEVYITELKRDLIRQEINQPLQRLRHLPGRVQIAAIAALIAGFGLLIVRRLTGTPADSGESAEVPILQQ